MEIKTLNKYLPNRDFTFARALDHVKGWMQGVIKLGDNREMMCIGKGNQTKLVVSSHIFDNHLGKQVSIHLDKEGKILNCSVKEHDKVISLVEGGRDQLSQNISLNSAKLSHESNRELN